MHDGRWLLPGLALMAALGAALAGLRYRGRQRGEMPEAQRQWARRLADTCFDGLLIHRNGTILAMNTALVRMLGYREPEMLGTQFASLTHPAMVAALRMELEAPQPEVVKFTLLHADTTERFVDMASHNLEFNGLPATVTAIRNITPMRLLEERLAHMTHNDSLTGLPNRAQFTEKLHESVALNDRSGGSTVVITLELDQLKVINEQLGRTGGDSLLRQLAKRLLGMTHEDDTVARLGGDKFGIVQPHTGAPNRTASLTSQIETGFHEAFIVEGKAVNVSLSIGIAIYPEHATDAESLLRASSLAMDQVSMGGGGGSRMFSHADAEAAAAGPGKTGSPANTRGNFRGTMTGASRLAQDLRLAIPHGEIHLDYQPIFSSKFLSIAGFEAFARWRHPKEGLIAPAQFIPLADEAGLASALGNFILETACFEAMHGKLPLMAVNLSPAQFQDPQLPAKLHDILRKTGLPAERLELEVTEAMLTSHPEAALQTLQELRRIGAVIVLDDFGAGVSSLNSLSNFPFNKIKIEKRFIQALGQEPSAEAIVAAILSLARNLRIEAVAEGVETEAQLTYLQEKGCQFVQGYHLGRPGPQASMFALVQPATAVKPSLVATQR